MVVLRNFDVRNCNAEIGLEKQNDSPKIGMVGISANSQKVNSEGPDKTSWSALVVNVFLCLMKHADQDPHCFPST